MVGYCLKLISAIGQHRKQALDSGDGYSDMRFTAKCTPVAWANNRALEMRSDTLATSASVARLRIVADYGPHDAAPSKICRNDRERQRALTSSSSMYWTHDRTSVTKTLPARRRCDAPSPGQR